MQPQRRAIRDNELDKARQEKSAQEKASRDNNTRQTFKDDLNTRIGQIPDQFLRNILRDMFRGEPSTYENSPHRERRAKDQQSFAGHDRRKQK